jgi:ADP-heptose:LPS heptosyltransferase
MKNILVLRLSSMGDVILITPLLSFLKTQHSSHSITLVTGIDYASLFTDDPRLAAVIGIGAGEKRLPKYILDNKWDFAVDLQNNRRSHTLLRSIDADVGRGYFDKLYWQRLALLFFRCDTYDSRLHVARRYIHAAACNSVPDKMPPLRVFFSDNSRRMVRTKYLLPAGNTECSFLALFPFSAWKNKEWPAESYIEVGRYFLTKGWIPVIMGGQGDVTRAQKLESGIGGRCISLAGRISIYECGALLTGFSLALGNDTGLSHLARACGVRTGIFFGPTTRHFGYFPYGDPAYKIFEVPLSCRPCHAHGGNQCLRLTHGCMRLIGPELVIKELEELFEVEASSIP